MGWPLACSTRRGPQSPGNVSASCGEGHYYYMKESQGIQTSDFLCQEVHEKSWEKRKKSTFYFELCEGTKIKTHGSGSIQESDNSETTGVLDHEISLSVHKI